MKNVPSDVVFLNCKMMKTDSHLPGPFSIPAAWRGPELFERDDWQCELGTQEIQELESTADAATEVGRDIEALQKADFDWPRLRSLLSEIQYNLENRSGVCMIRGLPVRRFTEQALRRIFWGIALHIGTPVSQSARGDRIFHVRDEGWQQGQPQARGPNTRKGLSFHTDRCDVIGFLCLRQALSGGDNQLVSSVTLFNVMRERWPDSTRVLMEPFWYQRHNVDTANSLPYCQQPIFSCHDGFFAASYLRVLIDRAHAMPDVPDLSPDQLEALERLEELAADPELHVTLRQEPGDLMFLNNWVTFHRRDEFIDAPDPALRRHLLRVWLAVPNSRPLDPRFAANYGSTKAGAVRGGMTEGMSK
jgi:hypothetical protein